MLRDTHMQRALIIGAVVVVLGGIGVGLYFYFAQGDADLVVDPGGVGLPDAREAPTPPIDDESPAPTGTNPITPTRRLAQVSKGPVVPGMVLTDRGGEVVLTYLERQSGNIFEYLPRTGGITRVSNRTIPGIQEAHWLPSASTTFVRYLSGEGASTINTYALSADGSSGFFLAQNLTGIAVSSTTVLTLASGVNGSIVSSERPDGSNLATLFSTPLTALRIGFLGATRYLAFTKPSAKLAGYAFVVDRSGSFSRIAGPLNGLVALASPSGEWVLVSSVRNGEFSTRLVNVASREAVTLPIATLADKCAWAADSRSIYCGVPVNPPSTYAYPDDWYQGAVSFSDRIWKVDVVGRYAQLVLDFSKTEEDTLDVRTVAVDPQGTVLSFMNKADGSLWAYQL